MSNGCLVVGKYDPATRYMSFELALHQMKKGGKVRRDCWSPGSSICIRNGFFMIGKDYKTLTIVVEDLLAEDWVDVI